MKKFILSLAVALMGATAASAAPISLVTVTFGSNDPDAVSGISIGTSNPVTFAATFFSPLGCTGLSAALCGNVAVGPLGGTVLSSSTVETFQLGINTVDGILGNGNDTDTGLRYRTNGAVWVVAGSGASGAIIETFGFYFIQGDEANTLTAGRLSFSFPIIQEGQSNLAAQGLSSPVPEPSTFLFVSSGLIGLGLIRRRRMLRA